ncbi:MAG: leukotriene A4 hydrolase C-terminal domain-containing protein [Thermodesulfovibrionia bacterium]|nr:leukotriene A4 hydrolase C-terminal domain-containing protein [Thermodesulfovibrionia bacterium]
MSIVESLYGPYRWGRYDLLFLPSSFPYGGMENPMLTFLTPTLLVGDKSLVYIAVHELVHSWSGNLVSNATWSDFWINEGFTMHTEMRILEALYGKRMADMTRVLGWQDLQAALDAYPPEDQILHINLEGRDPEQHAMTPIPYEKENLFLVQVEQVFGRDLFDLFLNDYFNHFGFQSITTKTLETYLNNNLLSEQPELAKEIPVKEWLYDPGLPSSAPQPYSEALAQVEAHVEAYADGDESASDLPGKQWNAQEWVYFLRTLPAPLGMQKMNELDQIFDLTDSSNAEILFQWLLMSIQSDYAGADQALEDFLISVGRLKFVRPLYKELAKTDAGHARALEIYKKARPNYHPITVRVVDEILDFNVLGFVI